MEKRESDGRGGGDVTIPAYVPQTQTQRPSPTDGGERSQRGVVEPGRHLRSAGASVHVLDDAGPDLVGIVRGEPHGDAAPHAVAHQDEGLPRGIVRARRGDDVRGERRGGERVLVAQRGVSEAQGRV